MDYAQGHFQEVAGMTYMSSDKVTKQRTQHAFLVAWGWFAQETSLIQKIQAIPLKQKTCEHSPQSKVLEFLVGTLAGLRHLQELSMAAHPLDCDLAVAMAWEQPGWANYSGVSRTMSSLSWEQARAIVLILEEVGQPYLQAEIKLLRTQRKRLCMDGDLTGLPVSNSSQTYPNVAFGHMDNEIQLGYQASVVSLVSPSYGRIWLSVAHHPGDTVSCTQAEALVLEAERRTELRPRRRIELLGERIGQLELHLSQVQNRLESQQKAVQHTQECLDKTRQEAQECQIQLDELVQDYQSRQRCERPTSHLAQSRKRHQTLLQRLQRREHAQLLAEQRLAKTQNQLHEEQSQLLGLKQRLNRFQQENAGNLEPVEIEFRLDAGFGTYENVALLIEMGYEVYTKPYGHRVTNYLKQQVTDQTTYTRVGANAEMVAWPKYSLQHCPYPLDTALERFYTGSTLKYSTLFHYGSDPVTLDLPTWFNQYNGRQIIEAGIKEGKQVFYLHKLKVRSEPAIFLQECFVLFAANFIRWATHWLVNQAQPAKNALDVSKIGIKRQVTVAAHVSAQVIRNSEGRLLKFSKQSSFAGKVLQLPGGPP
jgi:hypothetical protein